jgi:hypothetical protein
MSVIKHERIFTVFVKEFHLCFYTNLDLGSLGPEADFFELFGGFIQFHQEVSKYYSQRARRAC